jgi:hypothetical protein
MTTTATVVADRAAGEQALAAGDKVVVDVVGLVITSSTTIDMTAATSTAGRLKVTAEAARPRAVRLAEVALLVGRRVDLAAEHRKGERIADLLT